MLTEGMMFGIYRIEKRLGSGGMGAVYKAVDTVKDRVVAVKVIHPHVAEIEQFIKRFHQEAKLLEKLAHPKVVRIYDSGVIDGHHYIVMEFISGKSLTDVMGERRTDIGDDESHPTMRFEPLPEEGVLRILEQMVRVLSEAAELGVIHRDIKPDNILVTDVERWDIKLLDFGIAKDTAELHTMLSQTGQVMGTPAYMSPEQCEGKRLDIRSDLYSLGVMAYQCASGRLPFEGPTTMAFIKQHLMEQPKPLHGLNPKLSPGLVVLIHKLLAKSPEERYQTPLDLLEDLNRVRRGELPRFAAESPTNTVERTPLAATFGTLDTPTLPVEDATKDVTVESEVSKPRRKVLFLLVTVLVLAGAVLALYSVLPVGKKRPPSERLPRRPVIVGEEKGEKDEKEEKKPSFDEAMKRLEEALKSVSPVNLPSIVRKFGLKKRLLVRVLKNAAEEAERTKNWDKAEALYREMLRIGVSDEAKKALARIEKEKQYRTFMAGARKAFDEGDYETAGELAKKASGLFRREGVLALLAMIDAKKRAAGRLENWRRLVKAGDEAMRKGDWRGAKDAFKEALGIRSDAAVEAKLKTATKELAYAQKMTEARIQVVKRNYKDAALLFSDAKLLFDRREAANGLCFATVAAAGIEAFEKADYQRAETYFSSALNYHENEHIRWMLTLSKAHRGNWWRMLKRKKKEFKAGEDAVISFAISGNELLIVSADGRVQVFDSLRKEAANALIRGCTPTSFAVRKNLLVLGVTTGYLLVGEWSVKKVEQKGSILAHKSWVRAVVFASDETVVSAGFDGKLCIVDVKSNKVKKRIDTGLGWIYDIRLIDEARVAVASADRTVSVWNIKTGVCEKSLSGHKGVVWGLSKPSKGRIASVANDGTLCLWDIEKGRLIRKVSLGVKSYVVVTDGDARIALCGTDDGFIIVDMMQKKVLRKEMLGSKVKALLMTEHFDVLCGMEDGRIVVFGLDESMR